MSHKSSTKFNNLTSYLVFLDWKVYRPMAVEQETLTEYQENYKELLVKYASNSVDQGTSSCPLVSHCFMDRGLDFHH